MSFIQMLSIPLSFQNSSRHYQVAIYRGDLEYPSAPGNKWHKLKYHLQEAARLNASHIGTFGGPFSNHLHAFATSLQATQFNGVAVVRGELQPSLTPTLVDAANLGIELWPCSRKSYRLAEASDTAEQISHLYPNIYWIPEGGGGKLGARGCQEWAANIGRLADEFDAWVVSSGTGTTAAGLLANDEVPHLHVVSALKGAEAQADEIIGLAQDLISDEQGRDDIPGKVTFHHDAHVGGYAKHSPEFIEFLQVFADANPGQVLDPVYTGKSLYSMMKKIRSGDWPHERNLLIHTGGVQGWRGYPIEANPFIGCSADSDK